MQLKNSYSARDGAALRGLSGGLLPWGDARRLFMWGVASKPTAAGGFTERRYTPVDLLELMVLADLRRQGLSVARIRLLLETLRGKFGIRLFDAVGGAGAITLLTDGTEIYARLPGGEFVNLLRAPDQPLLVVGDGLPLRQLTARTKPQSRKKVKRKAGKKKSSD